MNITIMKNYLFIKEYIYYEAHNSYDESYLKFFI